MCAKLDTLGAKMEALEAKFEALGAKLEALEALGAKQVKYCVTSSRNSRFYFQKF